MKLWEVGGWLLLLAGLYIFFACFNMLALEDPPRFVQSIPLVTIGIVVFRGGLHLLKVSAAAQACRMVQQTPAEAKPAGKAATVQPRRR